ncbi:MAG: MBL fold metallo-hydrolase [Lachnospiraceae bacterium]|nr:MBL fold metallo-hydrolase [Lachnospiraceae bacterium]
MLVKILMENTTNDPALHAEHGLSVYIESQGHKLMVDTGASDLTWENAKAMGVDVSQVERLLISHGHFDHAGGIMGFTKLNPTASIHMKSTAFGDFYHGDRYIGVDKRIEELPQLSKSYGNAFLDTDISIMTRFPGRLYWPAGNKELTVKTPEGDFVQDSFDHEHCLVVRENGRFALFSGCAHNGILNIVGKFREVYGLAPHAVFSGFHMMKDGAYTPEEISDIENTATSLKNFFPKTIFYTGHCTGDAAYDLMKPIMGDQLQRMYTGLSLTIFENEERFKPDTLEDLERIAGI